MSKPNESFVDTREWDFKARTKQIDLFNDDLDRTSATDFFNRTNGLGSPEFYQQKRLKELEEKENATHRGRIQTRRSQITQQRTEIKKVSSLNAADLNARKKPIDNLGKQLSSIDLTPIVIPEREDVVKARRESRSNSVTRGAAPASKREPLSQRVPIVAVPKRAPVVRGRSPAPVSIPKREPSLTRLPVLFPRRDSLITRTNPPVVSQNTSKPGAVLRPQKPVVPNVTKPISSVPKTLPNAPKSAPSAPKPIGVAKPALPKQAIVRAPIISANAQREPIITRSKQREIQRFSFMRPTEASRRRSINPEKSTLI